MSQYFNESLMQDDVESVVNRLKAERNRTRLHNDLREILGLPSGRRFIWELLSETGVFQTSFTGDNQTFFKEGKRDIGLFILNRIFQVIPECLTVMRAEHELLIKNEKNADEMNRQNRQ